jgi:pyruvate kinase
MKKHHNKTKIIATIGPASASIKTLEELVLAGMDICRINMSHGNHDLQQQVINNIRKINDQHDAQVGILVDLQGPKLRIGMVENNAVELKEGKHISFTTEEILGNEKLLYITYSQFPKDVKMGEYILIDDGKIKLQVINTDGQSSVEAKIINGGFLSSRKGVNLPNTVISLPSLTKKDLADLDFALMNDVEWIGLSFVRSAKDITDLKEIIASKNKTTKVIAKIEKPEAIDVIDDIIEATDGLMVARGDLGVEIPLEKVPLIQKMLVKKCIRAAKPVIIATQMMESMITNFSPTRAEVSDVCNSVIDGADALMLSAETSMGKFPVEVVHYMKRIVSQTEKTQSIYYREHEPDSQEPDFLPISVCYNACIMADKSKAKALIAMTNSGFTAFRLSSYRPKANVYIFTHNHFLLNQLSLVWGVRGFYYDKYVSTDETISDIQQCLKEDGYIDAGDLVINVASIPIGDKGSANMIKLSVTK